MRSLLVLLLVTSCIAQQPEAPSSSKKSWILFSVVAGADLGASLFDAKVTHDGLYSSKKGCVEKNGGDPYPSTGKIYAKSVLPTLGAIGLGVLFKKLHIPIAPYAAMGVDTYRHIHGGVEWYSMNCL